MDNEKLKILEMVQEGKINSAEGMELLKALEDTHGKQPPSNSRRYLRIRVDGDMARKVNVNIPLSLVKALSRVAGIGMKFIPEVAHREMKRKGIDLTEIDIEELSSMIGQGLLDEKLVDIDIDDPKEGKIRVEIYVD